MEFPVISGKSFEQLWSTTKRRLLVSGIGVYIINLNWILSLASPFLPLQLFLATFSWAFLMDPTPNLMSFFYLDCYWCIGSFIQYIVYFYIYACICVCIYLNMFLRICFCCVYTQRYKAHYSDQTTKKGDKSRETLVLLLPRVISFVVLFLYCLNQKKKSPLLC